MLGAVGEEDGLLGLDEIERVLLEAFLREQLRCGAEAVGVLWAATGKGQRGRRESFVVAGAVLTPPPLRKRRTQAVKSAGDSGKAGRGPGAHWLLRTFQETVASPPIFHTVPVGIFGSVEPRVPWWA